MPDSLKFHLKACTAEKPLKKRLNRGGEENAEAEEEKTPNLGLAARIAAAEKQGKIAPSPQKQKAQPKQIQIKSGTDNKRRDNIQIKEVLPTPAVKHGSRTDAELDELYQQMIGRKQPEPEVEVDAADAEEDLNQMVADAEELRAQREYLENELLTHKTNNSSTL